MKAEVLKNRMEKLNMSAYRISKKTGIPNATVCRIVNGEIKDPRLSIIKKITEVLEISIDDIISHAADV